MLERFSDGARRVLVLAQEEAGRFDGACIGIEHILLGLYREAHSLAAQVLREIGIGAGALAERVGALTARRPPASSGAVPFSPEAVRLFNLSLREALRLGHGHVETEDLLVASVRDGHNTAARVLVDLGADLTAVRRRLIELVSGYVRPEGVPAGRVQQPRRLTAMTVDAGSITPDTVGFRAEVYPPPPEETRWWWEEQVSSAVPVGVSITWQEGGVLVVLDVPRDRLAHAARTTRYAVGSACSLFPEDYDYAVALRERGLPGLPRPTDWPPDPSRDRRRDGRGPGTIGSTVVGETDFQAVLDCVMEE